MDRINYVDYSRVPVEEKSSVCVICMKYRIIILIIFIISLGQIILSYMANTPRTHACTHTHTLAHTPTHRRRRPGCHCSMARCAPNYDEVNAAFSPVPLAMNDRSVFFFHGPIRSDDQPPVPHIVSIFSIQRDPVFPS